MLELPQLRIAALGKAMHSQTIMSWAYLDILSFSLLGCGIVPRINAYLARNAMAVSLVV